MPDLEYHRPLTSGEVSDLLRDRMARPIAGATDLLVQMRAGRAKAASIVDLNAVPQLQAISQAPDGGLVIGATARLSQLVAHPAAAAFPALLEAAATVGSIQVRNRATLIGNICNASPAADTAPALLVYEAMVNIVSTEGERHIPVERFWLGPGMTALKPGEWVQSVALPQPGRHGGCYVKLGRTQGTDLAIVGVAAYVSESESRIALASVAPTPLRARLIELEIGAVDGAIPPHVSHAIQEVISPISDLRSSDAYRRAMTEVFILRALQTARERLAAMPEEGRHD